MRKEEGQEMKQFDAKKFLKKLYELSGNEEGAKVVVKEIKEKEEMAAEAKEKATYKRKGQRLWQ